MKTSTSIEDLFSSKEYTLQELYRIREAWGSKITFTPEVIEASRKTLAFMLLYSPIELQSLVLATVDELCKRESYMLVSKFGTASSS